jgi:hypothetical protein
VTIGQPELPDGRVTRRLWTPATKLGAFSLLGCLTGCRGVPGITMVELPTGTVTFLFTDLEGSTRLWEEQPDAMKDVLARHDAILPEAIEGHGGVIVIDLLTDKPSGSAAKGNRALL